MAAARRRLELAAITPERTLLEIARIAYANIASFFHDDGTIKSPQNSMKTSGRRSPLLKRASQMWRRETAIRIGFTGFDRGIRHERFGVIQHPGTLCAAWWSSGYRERSGEGIPIHLDATSHGSDPSRHRRQRNPTP
jgi:hypothetical protein